MKPIIKATLVFFTITTLFSFSGMSAVNDRKIIIRDPETGQNYEVYTRHQSADVEVRVVGGDKKNKKIQSPDEMSVVLHGDGSNSDVTVELKAVEPIKGRSEPRFSGKADNVVGSMVGAELRFSFGGKTKTLKSQVDKSRNKP